MPENKFITEDGHVLITEDGDALILERQICSSLSDDRYEWRTTEGVSKDTGVPEVDVIRFIKSKPDIVIQSRVPDKHGRALFTTRDHYRATHGFLKRAMDVYWTTHT